ncbi:MAG: MdtA/MuxA family multidrug efflux RND transporter periplasmic adaptor subunit [Thermoleophilia bacterium]
MKNVMEERPRLATAVVVLFATTVILFLYFLSTRPPSLPSAASGGPVVAHSNSGPVQPADGIDAAQTAYLQGIRDVPLQSQVTDQLGEGRQLEETIYVDLDGDGREEALVLIRSAGERRELEWRLYGLRDGRAQQLFDHGNVAQGALEVQGPRLVESEGVYAAGDQACCPSQMKKTYYVWQGDGLVVSRVEAAPPGA